MSEDNLPKRNFIEDFVEEDIANAGGKLDIITRFPPEPNGYLHIGHAKAICVDFGIAQQYGGKCNLRMDDTNPAKEDNHYVEAIKKDIAWLGFSWNKLCYAADYFEVMFEQACNLIKKDLAFVCDLTPEEMREHRGTLTQPGKDSPYRNRSTEENLQLFTDMRAGKYPDGSHVLRAKIDMASPNINMRDPIIYRIMRAEHYRTANDWCIYPMYDYAHPIEDMCENITHSLCTLEFEDHRPLYDWVVKNVDLPANPRQIEFARLNITRTIMSKRYLKKLVEEKLVSGWDDPRMPTLAGMRRRGYTPASIRDFCDRIGVAKSNSIVEAALLEHCVREDLAAHTQRRMAVVDPIKLIIDNYPEGAAELLPTDNGQDPACGTHDVSFSRELYIERDDFMLDPPKKFFRLFVGGEVRLKSAYILVCQSVVQDENGDATEVHCTYDPTTLSGGPNSGKKVKGTLHWVNAADCTPAEFRLYDYLLDEREGQDLDFTDRMNPASFIAKQGYISKVLDNAEVGDSFQFIRLGFFRKDEDSTESKPVFNRIVGLRDTWAKISNS